MKNKKRKYTMWQSIAYMVKTGWKHSKLLIFLCAISVVLNVAWELVQLFVAPEILRKVELAVPVSNLILTIVLFSLLLLLVQAGKSYVDGFWVPAFEIRKVISNDINLKACMTAFPNSRDPEALKLQRAAVNHTNNGGDATQHIWKTFISVITSMLAFVFYVMMLSRLNVILIVTVVITTLLSFWMTLRNNRWVHRHKDELNTYNTRQRYIRMKIESIELAKDIRIFGLKPWLTEIRDKAMAMVNGCIEREAKVYLLGNLVDLLLTAARNGVAYVLLIRMTLTSDLSAPEFLLYFTAIGNFAVQVDGILKQLVTLHRECQGISEVMEYLDYPEPFRFEGGIPIPEADGYELRLEHVSFRYPGAEKPVFCDLDLTIRPGEKLAVVGLNGAGKTTMCCCYADSMIRTQDVYCLTVSIFDSSTGGNTIDYLVLYSSSFQFWIPIYGIMLHKL